MRALSADPLSGARVVAADSTADAVRRVAADPRLPHAALGNSLAAEIYGGHVLLDGVDDDEGNQTRFVWLAPAARGGRRGRRARRRRRSSSGAPATSRPAGW